MCDGEEWRVEDGVGRVGERNVVRNVCRVDIVKCDVVVREDAVEVVGDEFKELVRVEDSVEEEVRVVGERGCKMVHIEVRV